MIGGVYHTPKWMPWLTAPETYLSLGEYMGGGCGYLAWPLGGRSAEVSPQGGHPFNLGKVEDALDKA